MLRSHGAAKVEGRRMTAFGKSYRATGRIPSDLQHGIGDQVGDVSLIPGTPEDPFALACTADPEPSLGGSPEEKAPGAELEEAALDAALEALTSTGWQDVDSAAAVGGGDVRALLEIAADLRRAIAATPSQQARLRHQAIISRTAWGFAAARTGSSGSCRPRTPAATSSVDPGRNPRTVRRSLRARVARCQRLPAAARLEPAWRPLRCLPVQVPPSRSGRDWVSRTGSM